jgi:hypothetical protein
VLVVKCLFFGAVLAKLIIDNQLEMAKRLDQWQDMTAKIYSKMRQDLREYMDQQAKIPRECDIQYVHLELERLNLRMDHLMWGDDD